MAKKVEDRTLLALAKAKHTDAQIANMTGVRTETVRARLNALLGKERDRHKTPKAKAAPKPKGKIVGSKRTTKVVAINGPELAYEARAAGNLWRDVAESVGYANSATACRAAAVYAEKNGKTWPLVVPRGGSSTDPEPSPVQAQGSQAEEPTDPPAEAAEAVVFISEALDITPQNAAA